MKRNDRNPSWKNYLQQIKLNGYETLTRLGNPLLIHKVSTPYKIENMFVVFFAHKSGRKIPRPPRDPDDGFSKNQMKGIKIYSEMGFKVSKMRMG